MQNALKITNQPKVLNCFSNDSSRKYLSKMIQNSKCNFGCQVTNETNPNHVFFCFWRNQAKNGAQTFLRHFKSWCHRIFLGSYRNEKPKGLGSFSFETLHSNVSFENRIFFERYLRAEIFEKSIQNFWSIGYFHFILDIFKI